MTDDQPTAPAGQGGNNDSASRQSDGFLVRIWTSIWPVVKEFLMKMISPDPVAAISAACAAVFLLLFFLGCVQCVGNVENRGQTAWTYGLMMVGTLALFMLCRVALAGRDPVLARAQVVRAQQIKPTRIED